MTATQPITKRRSIWDIAIGDKVLSSGRATRGQRGRVIALHSGSRAEIHFDDGTSALVCIPDLEFV